VQDGVVKLNGEWEFYWNQLLGPEELTLATTAKEQDFINLPSSWNGYQVNDEVISGDGCGSTETNHTKI
jgi:hypothetical protein